MLVPFESLTDGKIANFRLNTLPNDEILDWSKLKVFADDEIQVTERS